jgi:hypothetical protein
MKNSPKDILEKLSYFYPYLRKGLVIKKLEFMQKFPKFNELYFEIRSENQNDDAWLVTAKTLVSGIETEQFSESDLDELLFLLIEDTLFNSYLFKLDTTNLNITNERSLEKLLSSWSVPKENKILDNVISSSQSKDFIVCGYRKYDLDALRLLVLDKEPVKIHEKNQEETYAAYPTLIELDFRRNLLHIRLRDVDNIESDSEKIGTIRGRIENTLKFISQFSPEIKYSEFNNTKHSLFLIEENLLKEKRDQAQQKLSEFDPHIEQFINTIEKNFSLPLDTRKSTKEYISHSVLSIIATSLKNNELGDVVGIKFRNNHDKHSKHYAEVLISDKAYKCISTHEIYWLTLPVLQNQKAAEFLKIAKKFPSGFVIFNLMYSLNTINVRLMQRSDHPDKELERQPNDQKYSEVIDFLIPFLNFNQ